MQFTTTRTNLLAALRRADIAVDPRSDKPYARNVLLEAQTGDKVRIYATSSLLWIDTLAIDAKIAAKGAIVVNCERLLSVVSALTEEEIKVTVDAELGVTIKSGKRRFKLTGLAADAFPSLQESKSPKNYLLDTESFLRAVKRVRFCMDPNRVSCDGALLEFLGGKKMRLVTLMGRAMASAEADLVKEADAGMFFLPRAVLGAVDALCKGQTTLRMRFDQTYATLETDETLFTCVLPAERFPEAVIHMMRQKLTNALDARMLGEQLSRAVTAVCAAFEASAASPWPKLALSVGDGVLRVSLADSPNQAEDELAVDTTGKFEVRLEPKLLTEALRDVGDEEVGIGFEAELEMVLITAPRYHAGVMRLSR